MLSSRCSTLADMDNGPEHFLSYLGSYRAKADDGHPTVRSGSRASASKGWPTLRLLTLCIILAVMSAIAVYYSWLPFWAASLQAQGLSLTIEKAEITSPVSCVMLMLTTFDDSRLCARGTAVLKVTSDVREEVTVSAAQGILVARPDSGGAGFMLGDFKDVGNCLKSGRADRRGHLISFPICQTLLSLSMLSSRCSTLAEMNDTPEHFLSYLGSYRAKAGSGHPTVRSGSRGPASRGWPTLRLLILCIILAVTTAIAVYYSWLPFWAASLQAQGLSLTIEKAEITSPVSCVMLTLTTLENDTRLCARGTAVLRATLADGGRHRGWRGGHAVCQH
ncbi:hypothetical protein FOZ60_001136 [Perkinsus olseni]|uniref:Uncharacterized protein n=1 Tax=Perkinsus olseni TaxID=32597 RepID=A0A7J6P0Z2_PEROL|nr:hypothetical protein FOZ60_001136 [Perkinsus olseni]